MRKMVGLNMGLPTFIQNVVVPAKISSPKNRKEGLLFE
jgi:hypothetical protein